MMVQRRSKAESTVDAIREREEEKKQATTLAMRRHMLAITLICETLVYVHAVARREGMRDSETNVDGSLGISLSFAPFLSLFLG